MMRFMHSRGSRRCLPAPRGAAILIAAFAGGCSAEISRFDFPSFNLADDQKQTTTASLQDSSGRSPSYLGNDRGGYQAPRSYRDGSVARTDLPDAGGSSPGYGSQQAYNDQSNYNQNSYGRQGTQPTYNQQNYNQGSSQAGYGGSSDYSGNSGYGGSRTQSGQSVQVQPGDTLYGISRRYGVTITELMEANGLSNPSLAAGQTLYLPQGASARPAPSRPSTAVAAAPVNVPPAVASRYDGTHTIRSGESLYAISRSYGVTVADLQRVNGITDPRTVKAGTVLKVPGGSGGDYGSGTAVAANTPPQQPASRVAVVPPADTSYGQQGGYGQQPTVINRQPTKVRTTEVTTAAIQAPSKPRSAGSDKLRWPVQGRILTGFGQRNDGTHNDGINLSVPQGTAVHAAEDGTVAYAGSELKGYGNLILLRHDNGWVTAYAHNDSLMVKRGDKVRRGQVIAKAGRTGSVDQPQVHFELRQGSKPVDPVPFLEQL